MKAGLAVVLLAITTLCISALAQENSAGYWVKKGDGLMENGSFNEALFEEALKDYDKALQIDPENSDAWVSKGQALFRSGYTRINGTLYDQRRHEEALKCFDEALRIDPGNSKAWEGRALTLDVLGRLGESLDAFDKAIEAWPANRTEEISEVWVKRGSVLLYAPGRQEETMESLDKAIQLDPRSTLAWTFKGYALKALGRYNESIEAFDRLIELNSSSTYAWILKAEALMAAGRYDEAGAAYDNAALHAASDGEWAGIWHSRAAALKDQGRSGEAVAAYDRALELYQSNKSSEASLGSGEYQAVSAWDGKGDALRDLGRYNESLQAYDMAIGHNLPDAAVPSSWILVKKGKVLDQMGRHEEALEAFDRATEAFPQLADAWINKGRDLQEMGRYEEALKAYDRAVQIDPGNAGAWLGIGDASKALFKNQSDLTAPPEIFGSDLQYADYWTWWADSLSSERRVDDAGVAYKKAVQLYDQYLNQNPEDAGAWINKGLALKKLADTVSFTEGQFFKDSRSGSNLSREAIKALDRAIELDPNSSEAWLAKGMALSNDSQRLQTFETALKLDPRNIKAWRYRGIALVNLAERKRDQSIYEDALKSYDKALEIDPREPRLWLAKANTLVAMGRYNESMESFDKSIEMIPADDTHRRAYFWRMKGSALEKCRADEASRAYNESLWWLNKTIDFDPKDPGAWTSRGYFLIYPLRRYNESLADFDRALELIPANDTGTLAYFWLKKAFALDQLNRSEETLLAYDKVTELSPGDSRGWSGRGYVLSRMGLYNKSLEAYDRAIELDPGRWGSLSAAWSGRAGALKALGRYNESLESFDKAQELEPSNLVMAMRKGDLLMKLGRNGEALDAFEKAIEIYPPEGELWYKKGLALEALGRETEAQASFYMAKRLGYVEEPLLYFYEG